MSIFGVELMGRDIEANMFKLARNIGHERS